MGHVVGLVDQQLDALAAAQDLLDVLHHDVFDLVELGLGARDLVLRGRGVVGVHERGDDGGERALEAVCGGGGEDGGGGGGGKFEELWGRGWRPMLAEKGNVPCVVDLRGMQRVLCYHVCGL